MKNLQKLIDLKYEVVIKPDWLIPDQVCVEISRKGERVKAYKAGKRAVKKLIAELLVEAL